LTRKGVFEAGDFTCCGEGLHEFAFWLSAQLALIQIADGLLERDLLTFCFSWDQECSRKTEKRPINQCLTFQGDNGLRCCDLEVDTLPASSNQVKEIEGIAEDRVRKFVTVSGMTPRVIHSSWRRAVAGQGKCE
jgi:hypothetical protein